MRLFRSIAVSILCAFALSVLVVPVPAAAQQTSSEKQVWRLEHAYWGYVKAVDLKGYRDLWNANFVGWPSGSLDPVRKSHITDWITQETNQGTRLKSYQLKFAASQSFGNNLVVDYYWATVVWSGKSGDTPPETVRMMHTWMRVGNRWQIIDGMAAQVRHLQR